MIARLNDKNGGWKWSGFLRDVLVDQIPRFSKDVTHIATVTDLIGRFTLKGSFSRIPTTSGICYTYKCIYIREFRQ